MPSLRFEKVGKNDRDAFRSMAEAYWRELMPNADVVNDAPARDFYFQYQFGQDLRNRYLCWAKLEKRPVGFISFMIDDDEKRASIHDVYVIPELRRKGHGSKMVEWLYNYLDKRNVERIDLNVRRDNPVALAFWEAQGFGITAYRMRQYRDPKTGRAFSAVLSSDV